MWLIFGWLTFTVSFHKGIIKDVAKQTIWFLANWFLKHGLWTCCEKLWVSVTFLWIAAVFHSFFFLLTLISFVGMDFQKFSSFFQVVGLLESFEMIDSCKIYRKMWFYVDNHGKTLEFLMKFSKKHSRKI